MDTFYSMRVQIPKSKIEPFVPTKIGLFRSLLNVCNLFLVAWEKALIISAAGRAFLRPRELETSRALTMKTVATRILHLFIIKNCKIILYCFFLSIHQVRVFATPVTPVTRISAVFATSFSFASWPQLGRSFRSLLLTTWCFCLRVFSTGPGYATNRKFISVSWSIVVILGVIIFVLRYSN